MSSPQRIRPSIPDKVLTELLVRCERKCCMCFMFEKDLSEKDGQVAHIDRNPENNTISNLAFLCLRHHNKYDGRPSQAKRYKPSELLMWRSKLYIHLDTFKVKIVLVIHQDGFDTKALEEIQQFVAGKGGGHIETKILIKNSMIVGGRIQPRNVPTLRAAIAELNTASHLPEVSLHVVPCDVPEQGNKLRIASEHLDDKRFAKAILAYKAVLLSDPENAEAMAGLSRSIFGQCRSTRDLSLEARVASYEFAVLYARQTVELEPDEASAWVRYSVALWELGACYEQGSNEEKNFRSTAKDAIDHSIIVDPRMPSAWLNRGIQEANAGNMMLAIEYLERALELEAPEAGEILAEVHRRNRIIGRRL